MECDIVIRAARPQDKEARAQIIEDAVTSYDRDAIIFFILQETTVQACVLVGALVFIFSGAGAAGAALAAGAPALLAAGGVLLAHRAAARRAAARLPRELAGFVAEHGGAVVGTLSLARHRAGGARAWLRAPCVAAAWRRRGLGAALERAARAHAAARRLRALEAAPSALQAGARALLLARGWALRGTFHRRLLGAALTLPMVQLGLDLPADEPPTRTVITRP